MSAQEVIDLKRDIVTARIDGMLCRAEEDGRKAGVEAGKLETARRMLEDDVPLEKIVRFTGLSEDDVLNAK